MKLKFLGAAQTVTGSCFVLETASTRFAVDCGMHQGAEATEKRNHDARVYAPEHLHFIVITHAHIDHAGLLPLMAKHGFKGWIYATPPTVDLLKIMLADAAHVQEVESFWKNKKILRHGGKPTDPLYTADDAQAVLPLLKAIDYDETFSPAQGISMSFRDGGHILGSAFVIVETPLNGVPTKIVFSGDIGRSNQLIINDPSVLTNADYLVMESTYGDRLHRDEARSLEELAEAIAHSYGKGGKVVIPAFAVERTQEVLYALHLLAKRGQIPKDMPVFVDSPLAIRAIEIFKNYRSFFDEETKAIFAAGDNPFAVPNLHYTLSTQESMDINTNDAPAIIISASGMANAGRIKHHLRHNLWRENAAIVFVGFQASGTIGRKIIDGALSVHLFNENVAVAAKVFTINGFSAHADQRQMLEWLGHFSNRQMRIFLVHGELNAQETFKRCIMEKFGFSVHIPRYLEEIDIDGPTDYSVKEPAFSEADSEDAFTKVEAGLAILKARQAAGDHRQQEEIKARLLEFSEMIDKMAKNDVHPRCHFEEVYFLDIKKADSVGATQPQNGIGGR